MQTIESLIVEQLQADETATFVDFLNAALVLVAGMPAQADPLPWRQRLAQLQHPNGFWEYRLDVREGDWQAAQLIMAVGLRQQGYTAVHRPVWFGEEAEQQAALNWAKCRKPVGKER